MPHPLFDAHLDLAYLAVAGRDMRAEPESCGVPHPPASVTLPALRRGGVDSCLATIFTQAIGPTEGSPGPWAYTEGDGQAARIAGLRQLDIYEQWQRDGLVALLPRRGTPRPPAGDAASARSPLRIGILMECADPLLEPDDIALWADRGVIAVGMAWVRRGRYAAGNACEPDDGLTDRGRALIPAMDALGIVHDLSHLSPRATDELLAATDAPVIASHSNCRALLPDDAPKARLNRQLSDDTIREIGRRSGVIGINLFSDFLRPTCSVDPVGIEAVVHHIEHICEVVGHRRAVGLGSDMDGGFSASKLACGIREPRDLRRIDAALAERGWTPREVSDWAFGNWGKYWGVAAGGA